MKQPNNLFAIMRTAFLSCMFVLFAFTEADASHFRYGNITWDRVAGQPNTIHFTVTQAWRTGFFHAGPNIPVGTVTPGTSTLDFGDGNSVVVNITATTVNVAEDWFYGTFEVTHTYSNTGTYTAFWQNCCRLSSLQNNNDLEYVVSSTVNVGASNDAPVTNIPAIVNMPAGVAAANFQIPTVDPNGDILTYSLSAPGSFGSGTVQPTGLTISPTGLITFNTIGKSAGQLYNTSVTVNDAGGSMSQIDFLIRMTQNVGTPPAFNYPPTPTNNIVFNVSAGNNLMFNVEAMDADAGDIVGLSAVGLPAGSVFSPGNGNPVNQSFSWTPTAAQVGNYQIDFVAQDNSLNQTHTIVNIVVDNCSPSITCPANMTVSTDPGQCDAVLNYTLPTVVSCCNAPAVLAGYTMIGTHNGHTYYKSDAPVDWISANTFAQSMGGHLATVDDAAEDAWLFAALGGQWGWIGYNDAATEGSFVWTSGASAYTNWCGGEPNNFGGEDYGYITPSGCWNDIPNTGYTVYALIEYDCMGNNTPVLISGPASGGIFPKGNTVVTYAASNDANAATCSFTVKVKDEEAPVLTCPAPVVKCKKAGGTYQLMQLVATDNCNVPNNKIQYVFSGATLGSGIGKNAYANFGLGVTTITWTGKDAANNTTVCTTTVTVNNCPARMAGEDEESQAIAGAQEISIYPNPTSGSFTVDLGYVNEKAEIKVIDAQGRLIESRNVDNQTSPTLRFDLANVSAGVYFVTITKDGVTTRNKVVLQ